MLVELSIMPLDAGGQLSHQLAEVLKLVDDSGVPYKLTPTGTCIEGDWEQVMSLVHQCHTKVRQDSSHVVTIVKIEDQEGQNDMMAKNVQSVEEKVGKQLQT